MRYVDIEDALFFTGLITMTGNETAECGKFHCPCETHVEDWLNLLRGTRISLVNAVFYFNNNCSSVEHRSFLLIHNGLDNFTVYDVYETINGSVWCILGIQALVYSCSLFISLVGKPVGLFS